MSENLKSVETQILYVVFNPFAGLASSLGLTAEALERKFQAAGLVAEIDSSTDQPSDARRKKALESGAHVIVAAGGDGTAAALAAGLVGTGKTLALLPLGTANLLARDLGIPLNLDQAITGLAAMTPRRIDVGEVNGRIFLNRVVIGTIPNIAVAREMIRRDVSLRSRLDFICNFLHHIINPRPIALQIEPIGAGRKHAARAHAVVVANNAYEEGRGRFFSRARLDQGMLVLYVLKRLSLLNLVRLTLGMLAGRWRQDRALAVETTESVVLQMKQPRVKVMIDGEVETLTTPLAFRIRPLALSILAPPDEEDGRPADGV